MRAQCSVFIATSLDGFISRPDGSIDWLEAANGSVPPGEDCGYAAFMSTIDTLVMGRKTFDLVRTFETWPYGDKRVHVISRGAVEIPDTRGGLVTTSGESPEALVHRLSDAGASHLYIDGGLTIQSFLVAGLIDDAFVHDTVRKIRERAKAPRDIAIPGKRHVGWSNGLNLNAMKVADLAGVFELVGIGIAAEVQRVTREARRR